MKNMVRPFAVSLGLVALTACGSGGGSGGRNSLSADAVQYNSLVDEYNGYLKKYKANGVRLSDVKRTPYKQMPVSGTATYKGVGHVDLVDLSTIATSDESSAVGTAQLKADFRTTLLSGNVTNFKSNKGRAVAGKLNVNSSILGNSLSGITHGSITLSGKNHQIVHRNAGIFMGKNAKGVMVLSTDETTSAGRLFDDSYIETSIIAEKN